MTETFEVIRGDGVRIRGEVRGPGGATEAVVLVHGLGFTRHKWGAQVEALIGAGYRVVTWDLRGFGESDLPAAPYSMEDVAADLEALRAHLGLGRFHLVGHSFGGMVALTYAVARPERLKSLSLLSTAGHNGERASKLARALTLMSRVGAEEALSDPDTRAEVEAIVESVADIIGPILKHLKRIAAKPDPARSFAWGATAGYSVRDRLGELTVPSLVMHGTKDELMPYVAGFLLAQALPGCTWESVEEGRHNLPLERSDEVNRSLLAFLGGVA